MLGFTFVASESFVVTSDCS